ncbi:MULTISPECIES: MmgE/PrpD family protein [unclassified Pseudomonas]|uniref:MmgE/PrpD family protein n=1 Tax=unclassified Pseudomonas TaxID=196821 RepID=UPI0021C7B80B|nr:MULTISPECIES: MmgE/PrpD family protein [unclassified Pseudomonas]MCU1733757.1 MmgE/PrpD family protein [Pseudomonas sp. 20P_3.2_Bac4]MCU1742557.1 MmgE/PrpD family protein [Pseudomonas sp. 20P_3.2_Bac5]
MTLEARVTQYCDDLTFASIDAASLEIASRSLLDALGVSLAGARDAGVKVLAGIVEQWGGQPQSRVLGRQQALPAPAAAMLNGAAARVLDFDDVADPLGTHPSVAILPPLLAIADLIGQPIDRQAFLTAFVAGQDLSIRLSRARKETLLESGRYDLCKVIAATAAAGKLYGLRGAQLHHALGIAYTSALGETQCMIDGASTVFYQQGLVAANAVRAVVLAANGFTGASQFLTGRWGYYNAFEPGSELDTIEAGLGNTFSNTDGIAFKPYPTCRPNTSAVALALELVRGRRLQAAEVVRIDVLTNRQIFDLVSAPIERKQAPTTVVEARFSLAYNIAAALTSGDLFIDDFNEQAILRPAVIALSRKIFPDHDPSCEIAELGTHGKIKIRIELADGTVLQGEVSHAKGNPLNPMSQEELLTKFNKCLAWSDAAQARAQSATIVDWIFDRDAINPSYQVLAQALHAPL